MTIRSIRGIRSDHGSILPLILGFGVLGLTIVLLVTAATSLVLERKRLFTVADAAALAGAEAFTTVRAVDGAPRAVLTSERVSSAVHRYLAEAPQGRFDGFSVVAADTPDGAGARVTLAAHWAPPLVTLFAPEGLRLQVTAQARTSFR